MLKPRTLSGAAAPRAQLPGTSAQSSTASCQEDCFIGRNPGITVSDLLAILRITKQALARVLNTLMEEGYVGQAPGEVDRRQRLLKLTDKGEALEQRLFERQRERLAPALGGTDPATAAGFRAVMRRIMDDSARDYLDSTHPPGRNTRTGHDER